MTNEITRHQQQLATLTAMPVDIPFDAYAEARERTIAHGIELPPYLLLPEVERLLEATLEDRHRLAFELMWYTGARVTETLKLRPKDIVLHDELRSYVSLENLKRRPSAKATRRMVPITDLYFITRLQRFIKTHSIRKLSPLLSYTRKAIYDALKKWSEQAQLPIEVTPHTLRHSFAINHLLHGQQLYDIKAWMGHSSIKSTEVYLQVLGADTAHLAARTRFRSVITP